MQEPRFPALTPESAVGASRELLGELVERHGAVGSMVSTMAHSPAVLRGYLELSRSMRRAKLERRLSELLSIAVQQQQGCSMCMDSHVSAARSLGVAEHTIELARAGTSDDPRAAAIITFALQVYREPAAISDEQVGALRAMGFSMREIADVVGVVSLNILTGAFNLVSGLSHRVGDAAD